VSTPLAKADAPKPDIQQQTKDPIMEWINKLEQIELPNRYPRDYCIVDSNGRLSCGCLQFQLRTFTEFSEKYQVKEQWKSCDAQKEVAYKMISDDLENAWHWATSVKKIGLPKQ